MEKKKMKIRDKKIILHKQAGRKKQKQRKLRKTNKTN